MGDGERVVKLIQETYPDAVLEAGSYHEQHWARLDITRVLDILYWLRDDPETGYDFLVDITAVHWPDRADPLEVVYHLYSYSKNDRLRVKVNVDADGKVPSAVPVWESAEWNEREAYDMFGVTFEGHPDLRRILMPEDYDLHPLRKEFPLYSG